VLVFDTETTTDSLQNLLFGFFQIYERGELRFEGLFQGDNLKDTDISKLQNYCQQHNLELMPVREFVEIVLIRELVDLHTLCVGFNLPFDLSRLAISCGVAREANYGGFSFKLSEDLQFPRLIIKNLNSKASFIKFSRSLPENCGNNRKRKTKVKDFEGNFLDLRTLSFALTNESHTLESACKYFKADSGKTHVNEHGKITSEYIEYNRNDVKATYALYRKALEEYEKFGLDESPLSMYSPASLGKAYFRKMGFSPFMNRNPRFSRQALGWVMSTYYGGRSEVRVRKAPMRVALIDFLSMYPTMCILQNLWKFVIASRVDAEENTEAVQAFLDRIRVEELSDRSNWQELNSICLIQPDECILPIRAKYGNNITYNIGINYVSSDEQIWYTLADVIASKILTGKTPKILRAITFKASGVQRNMKPISLIGGQAVDPMKDDFFLSLMNYRQEVKLKQKQAETADEKARLDTLQRAIKVITNATCYGIFIESNPASGKKEKEEVKVYGQNEPFAAEVPKIEKMGRHFSPILGTMITASARLVLAITEALLQKHNSIYAFCDTDSMAIPEEYLEEVQSYFQKLSPYQFDDALFKLEKENFHPVTKEKLELWFYGIAVKRYVLYYFENGIPVVRKHSLHGLGHILNPFRGNPDKKWQEVIWKDILAEHYNPSQREVIEQKYASIFAVSKMAVTSTDVLRRFRVINKGKSYDNQVKPFNFFLIGGQVQNSVQPNDMVKPMAPFTKDPQKVVHQQFIDYSTGNVLCGMEYWKPMTEVYFNFKKHPEAKFAGDVGVLQRRHVRIKSVINIGKESNNLDDSEILGVKTDDYQIIANPEQVQKGTVELDAFILQLKSKTSVKYGISKRQLIRMQRKVREGSRLKPATKTLKRLNRCYEKEMRQVL